MKDTTTISTIIPKSDKHLLDTYVASHGGSISKILRFCISAFLHTKPVFYESCLVSERINQHNARLMRKNSSIKPIALSTDPNCCFFDPKVTSKHGLSCGVVFYTLQKLIHSNSIPCKKESGVVWGKVSLSSLHSCLPFLTKSCVKKSLAKLEKFELIAKKASSSFDRSNWYSLRSN